MIDKIKLQNVESHKETELNLDPGVNVIVGNSDSGKSAILRALRWVIRNRPSGDSFRTRGGGDTSVELSLDNQVVKRVRTKQKNQYIINNLELNAVKTEVPEEVSNLFNINEANLQQQLDRHFLLDNSPGGVAKHFNQIAHLDVIDCSTQKVQSWIRELTRGIESKREQMEQLKIEAKQYDYLDEMEGQVVALEQLHRELEALSTKRRDITKILNQIQTTQDDLIELQPLLNLGKIVDDVIQLQSKQEQVQKEYTDIDKILSDIIETKQKIKYLEQLLTLYVPVKACIKLLEAQEAQINQARQLSDMIEEIGITHQNIIIKQSKLEKLEIKFNKLMPNICPLCGQKITKEKN